MKSFHQKTQITEQHGITECEYCVYLTFSFSLFTSTDRRWCLFPIQKTTKAIFATPTKQFLLADEEFSSKKNQITEQHGITECEYCVYLTFSFSLFTSTDRRWCLFPIQKITKAIFATPTKQFLLADEEFSSKNPNNWVAWNYRMWVLRLSHVFIFIFHLNRQEVMFVSESKDNKSYLRDTNETFFASRWRVFSKTHITQQHGITECEYCVYLMFSFSLFTSTDRKWCLFAIRKITKAIFATPTKQCLLADEEFSSKNPNNWAAWNYRMWVLRLSHVFIFIIHLNRQEVMFVSDSKDKSYFRDTNETIFASRWRVFFKKPT